MVTRTPRKEPKPCHTAVGELLTTRHHVINYLSLNERLLSTMMRHGGLHDSAYALPYEPFLDEIINCPRCATCALVAKDL